MEHTTAEAFLLRFPQTEKTFPFGEDVAVFKVKSKMFATLAYGNDKKHYWMNLKCEPHEALQLRDMFDAVIPGYHMNKKHWNTVILDGSIPDGEIKRMMENSFRLVVAGMPKSQRASVEIHL